MAVHGMNGLFLLAISLTLVAAIPGSYWECKQAVYTCSCVPTNTPTPYEDQNDCNMDCCPSWSCDHTGPLAHACLCSARPRYIVVFGAENKCKLDLAGGRSLESCAESCGNAHFLISLTASFFLYSRICFILPWTFHSQCGRRGVQRLRMSE
jgi:hypothetical protein